MTKLKNQSVLTQTAYVVEKTLEGKKGGKSWIDSGQQGPDRCLQGRMWRYPVNLGEHPG